MPTQPDPNSPYLASRVEAALGVRSPGTPTMAGKPGVQAADLTFPAPPAPATGQPGRPTTPQVPTPFAGTPQARTPAAKPGAAAKQPAPKSPGAAPASQPTQPAVAPLGVPVPSATGGAEPDLALTPEGDMRYRAAVLAGRDSLGPIPRVFRHASLPELPFELGRQNWNPFTGMWSAGAAQGPGVPGEGA